MADYVIPKHLYLAYINPQVKESSKEPYVNWYASFINSDYLNDL